MQQGASSTDMQGFVKSYIQQIKEQAIPVTEQFKKIRKDIYDINNKIIKAMPAGVSLRFGHCRIN